jgi:limonene-1,2-epoxide hydrolase
VSQENADAVRALYPPSDVDLVALYRDDEIWASWAQSASAVWDEETQFAVTLLGDAKLFTGLDGLRAFWLEWMAPWETYRRQLVETVDCGERVLVRVEDFARRHGSPKEVRLAATGVYEFRDGRITRFKIHSSHAKALKAVGLEG